MSFAELIKRQEKIPLPDILKLQQNSLSELLRPRILHMKLQQTGALRVLSRLGFRAMR
jgi:hypothetical protein